MSQQSDEIDNALPKPTAAEVMACQFSSWYSTFRDMNSNNDDDDKTKITTTTTTPSVLDPATTAIPTKKKKLRNNVTIESRIISPLPSDFVEYLLSDGVMLPKCAGKVSSCMKNDVVVNTTTSNASSDDENDKWDSSSEEAETSDDDDNHNNDNINDNNNTKNQIKKYNFPTLTHQIQSAITQLQGSCIPKLNWSSPKDATWINCGSIKCHTAGDVYLLFKSSEFVAFDLEKAWDGLLVIDNNDDDNDNDGVNRNLNNLSIVSNDDDDATRSNESTQSKTTTASVTASVMSPATTNSGKPHDFEYELVLRKWCNLHPSMEFRCFVHDHELVGISQRHPSKYYVHLQPQSTSTDDSDEDNDNDDEPPTPHPLSIKIHNFFQTYIRHKFAHGAIHRYVMDLYIDSQERVWIIDFNVWARRTEGLLFDWKELIKLGEVVATMKKIQQEQQLQNQCNTISYDKHGTTSDSESKEEEVTIPMPEMRVVTKDMKSMTYDPLSTFRGPTDVMDLMSSTGGASQEFEEFMKRCVKPSEL